MDLKPCPFCGGEAIKCFVPTNKIQIQCKDCGGCSWRFHNEEQAEKHWNQRVQKTPDCVDCKPGKVSNVWFCWRCMKPQGEVQ